MRNDELNRYADELRDASWNDKHWPNFRKKMNAICTNAEIK